MASRNVWQRAGEQVLPSGKPRPTRPSGWPVVKRDERLKLVRYGFVAMQVCWSGGVEN